MTADLNYRNGMSLGWRLCFILSLFATIPRLIFAWPSLFHQSDIGSGILDICIQFIISFEFAWIFVYICLHYTYEMPSWFNRQNAWVQLFLLLVLFLGINEILFQLKLALDDDNSDIVIFRVVYYLYHVLLLLAILGFRNFLLTTQENHRIGLENEQLKREQLKAQLEALRNQLNPHFLFNALNILNISISTNPDLAQRIVLDLSDILRYNLKVQNQSLILLTDELAAAKAYLDLYKARFGEKMAFEFIDTETSKQWYIIPLSLQILIENAIKHNVISSHQVLMIEVRLIETEKQVMVMNTVNKKLNSPGTGIGLQNLDKRYKIQTGQKPSLVADEQQFTVKVPLIEAP
ncbi:sensor histidine kinase [Dyadobacter pollutisoli]|jgi:sensor histidine kinase YesM|uniref:Histidine kinase n=1 Tax=Dyadobacter pollutisoli TaxID=2910158 RepID=A0A9E8NHN8_9BACT|nr:histidine kinase [Dyadobacter pollutisoli]WAC14472.1 histidine kinase [Dyadobacter pollutisoli]